MNPTVIREVDDAHLLQSVGYDCEDMMHSSKISMLYKVNRSGKKFVAKALRPEHRTDSEICTVFRNEILMHLSLKPGTEEYRATTLPKSGWNYIAPAIEACQDVGKTGAAISGGVDFLIVEFVEGVDLENLLETPLAPIQAVRIALQFCIGMEYCRYKKHEFIHRDVKPLNVMISRADSSVKIIDFGLAKSVSRTGGTGFGTTGYMDDYAIQGRGDLQSDIYAFGVSLGQMVSNPVCEHWKTREQRGLQCTPGCRYRCRPFTKVLDLTYPSDVNDELKELVRSCVYTRSQRPTSFTGIRKKLEGLVPSLELDLAAGKYIECDVCRFVRRTRETSCPLCGQEGGARFTAEPTRIAAGQSVTLRWRVAGAERVRIEPGVGERDGEGSCLVQPLRSIEYILRARVGGREIAKVVPVDVQATEQLPPPPPTGYFFAAPEEICQGETCTLKWSFSEDSMLRVDPGVGPVKARDEMAVSPAVDTTYVVTGNSQGRAVRKEVNVRVIARPEIKSFVATPSSISAGEAAELRWETNVSQVVIDQQGVTRPGTGSLRVEPQQSTTYQLTASNRAGTARAEATVSIRDKEFVLIAAGAFQSGCSSEMADKLLAKFSLNPANKPNLIQRPEATRTLPAFQITRTAITNSQYWEFVRATEHPMPPDWDASANPPFPEGMETYPVINVDWHDANRYCEWKDGRLPREEEWERAARSVDGRLYPWGNEYEKERCNGEEAGHGGTVPGDYHKDGASPEGVLNLVGNVWEWTATETPLRCAGRGGSYRHPGAWAGLPFLDFISASATAKASDVGFRVVRSAAAGEVVTQITVNSLDLQLVPGGVFRSGIPAAAAAQIAQVAEEFGGADGTKFVQSFSERDCYMGGFYISRYPVTNAQYLQFVQATNHAQPTTWLQANPPFPQALANVPVVQVSLQDALAFAKWMGAKFRMPTGREWDKAARGPHGALFPWGDTYDPRRCNCSEARLNRILPVNASIHATSPYGVVGMTGNVAEWVISEMPRRGGSYQCDCAYFGLGFLSLADAPMGTRTEDTGFRCVRDLSSKR